MSLRDVKPAVAMLAVARRDLLNARTLAEQARARGVLTFVHQKLIQDREARLEFCLEQFLASWGAWAPYLEVAEKAAQRVEATP